MAADFKYWDTIRRWVRKGPLLLVFAFIFLMLYYFSLPRQLFTDPGSTVINDRDGKLLGARIAADGQWRFPETDSVSYRFEKALLTFEDKHFYRHPGVNPLSIGRALLQNIKARRTVSGASTISMQVIRLSRKGKPRNVGEKLYEVVLASRLELRYSKQGILMLYASHAPFGGNVVGLDAAAWRYFGRSAHELSWAESATLAVLPNAPSLIFPGRNKEMLLQKRNRLLQQLHSRGYIDSMTCQLAMLEPLPGKPYPLPMHASHLLDRVAMSWPGQRIQTTIDPFLQERAARIVEAHYHVMKENLVHNAAVVVAEVSTGRVLAYIGNTFNLNEPYLGHQVDVVTAPRSTGSILKPFLFARLMEEGTFLPGTLVPDIPTQIAGYSPKNYFLTYDGAVPARRSLSRSLNVPSVRMLRDYGVEKFHHELKKTGMSTLNQPPGHYGLSLILGGAEATLWDITGMYASYSRVLKNYYPNNGLYDNTDIRGLYFNEMEKEQISGKKQSSGLISAASVWLTYEALVEVNRPEEDSAWELFSSKGRVAWKTGTSFGGRDAWAVGTTRDYVVGVWVGNATGEGRPDLTGLSSAAPLMFRIFDLLPSSPWFEQPFSEMEIIATCRQSGHRAGMNCTGVDSVWVHRAGLNSLACPYHVRVHLDEGLNFRVNSQCVDIDNMVPTSWFVLPPVMEWYYKRRNPSYQALPPFREDCVNQAYVTIMEMIYPRENTAVFIPRQIDSRIGEAIFEVAHRNENATIYWHLNEKYMGQTTHIHQMGLSPEVGSHSLTLVDNDGQTLIQKFEVRGSN